MVVSLLDIFYRVFIKKLINDQTVIEKIRCLTKLVLTIGLAVLSSSLLETFAESSPRIVFFTSCL